MDKIRFTKKLALWTAIVAAFIIAIIGLAFGRQIETTLFGEISKWIVMGLVIIGILEGFVYFLAPLIWHFYVDPERKKEK